MPELYSDKALRLQSDHPFKGNVDINRLKAFIETVGAENIPSIRIRPGDRVQLAERARSIPVVVESLAEPALSRPEWLVFDAAEFAAPVTRTPAPDEVPFPVDVQQVVEYYAVRL